MQNTITGADMKVFFGFKNIYLKKPTGTETYKTLSQEFTWIDAGTVTQIRYAAQREATPRYTLTQLDPAGISKGLVMTQGDIIFKNFNEDSVIFLFKKVLTTLLDSSKNKVNPFDTSLNGFLDLTTDQTQALIDANPDVLTTFWSSVIENWDEMPFFDILVISKSTDFDATGTVSQMRIKDIKVTDVGASESADSTEVNDIVKFFSVGSIEPWKEITV